MQLKGDILVLYKKLKVIPDVNFTKTVWFFVKINVEKVTTKHKLTLASTLGKSQPNNTTLVEIIGRRKLGV